jgi:hypothetical protein
MSLLNSYDYYYFLFLPLLTLHLLIVRLAKWTLAMHLLFNHCCSLLRKKKKKEKEALEEILRTSREKTNRSSLLRMLWNVKKQERQRMCQHDYICSFIVHFIDMEGYCEQRCRTITDRTRRKRILCWFSRHRSDEKSFDCKNENNCSSSLLFTCYQLMLTVRPFFDTSFCERNKENNEPNRKESEHQHCCCLDVEIVYQYTSFMFNCNQQYSNICSSLSLVMYTFSDSAIKIWSRWSMMSKVKHFAR